MSYIACFDIGGTFIKYGIFDTEGNIIYKDKFLSPKKDCKNQIPLKISQEIDRISKKYTLLYIGISTAGNVDSHNGEIIFSSENLPDYTGAKLSDNIKKLTGLDSVVENDVNAAAMGEHWKGAGKGIDNFVCITLGTGIGAAIIINGKLYKGMKEGSGELGHMIINENGQECNCGGKGCYERYASTSGLVRAYEIMGNLPEGTMNGKDIFDKIKNNEPLAMEIYNKFINHVSTGLVNITHILDPGLIIIGGGISEAGELFFQELNNVFLKSLMPSYREYTRVVQAKLGNDAGIVGACYNVLNKLNYIK